MIISMDLELKDIPGQLVQALSPISEMGGNIQSVIHHREKKTVRGTIPVQIAFEIPEEKIDRLIRRLEGNGVIVARVGEERLRERISIVLIGHIVHSDIRDTIDNIDSTGFAEVVDIALSMPGIDEPSSARITINATGKKELRKALNLLREVAQKKDLLVIEPIEVGGIK